MLPFTYYQSVVLAFLPLAFNAVVIPTAMIKTSPVMLWIHLCRTHRHPLAAQLPRLLVLVSSRATYRMDQRNI